MTDLYNIEGEVKPRRINGVLNIQNNSELITQTIREAENMYDDINKIPNRRFLTEEQVRELLDIGDMVNSLINHKTFKS